MNTTLSDLSSVLDSATDIAILSTDEKGNISLFNKGAEKMLGYKASDIIGKSAVLFNVSEEIAIIAENGGDPSKVRSLNELYNYYTTIDKTSPHQWTFIRKDGNLIILSVTITVINDEFDNTTGYLCVANDITSFKKAEQELIKREERIRNVIDNLKEIIYQTDNKGLLTFLNPAWTEITGFTVEESLGKSILEFVHPEDRLLEEDYMNFILKGKKKFNRIERRFITQKGGPRWMEVYKQALFDEDENIIGIMGTLNNITERRLAESQLQTALTRLSTIIHYMQEGILAEDSNRIIVLVNEKLCNVFDLKISAEHLKGTSSRIFMDQVIPLAKDQDKFLQRIEDLITQREPVLNEEVQLTDGRILERDYIPIFIDRKYNGHLWQYRDITKRKLEEKEMIRAKENALKSMKAKDMFLSTMSHEIRTPLNAVIGMTHLLLEENPKIEQIENLKTLKFSAENLMVLINDILDYNKIDAGQITFEEIDFSLREIVNSIKQSLVFRADEKGVLLQVTIAPEIPQVLLGDPVRLAQILNNLASNAIKFTEAGSVKIDILPQNINDTEAHIDFIVTDTGIGIPEDKLEYIFYSFTQASFDITRKFGGTGLGLAITKRLLKMQKSDIKVESILGKGSKFYFTLRFKISSSKQVPQNLNPYGQIIFKSLKGVKLLLVEDSPINRLVATKFLSKWDISIDYAENGIQAIEKVKANQYDVVLMDLQMPEMDGYQATEAIRNLGEPRYTALPIIALTAAAMLDVKDQVFSVGMNDYLTKPFNPNELYMKILRYSKIRLQEF